jgi:hypothetical protein
MSWEKTGESSALWAAGLMRTRYLSSAKGETERTLLAECYERVLAIDYVAVRRQVLRVQRFIEVIEHCARIGETLKTSSFKQQFFGLKAA